MVYITEEFQLYGANIFKQHLKYLNMSDVLRQSLIRKMPKRIWRLTLKTCRLSRCFKTIKGLNMHLKAQKLM